jgi:hypothetical protein
VQEHQALQLQEAVVELGLDYLEVAEEVGLENLEVEEEVGLHHPEEVEEVALVLHALEMVVVELHRMVEVGVVGP